MFTRFILNHGGDTLSEFKELLRSNLFDMAKNAIMPKRFKGNALNYAKFLKSKDDSSSDCDELIELIQGYQEVCQRFIKIIHGHIK